MEININEVQVQKLNLQPGETLVVTVKSDDINEDLIDGLKRGFGNAFPSNRVIVMGMSTADEVKFSAIKEINEISSCVNSNFCADCNCGKKQSLMPLPLSEEDKQALEELDKEQGENNG
jgi:hypothetical protein